MEKIKEGDLYKIIKISDKEFEIKYGYYEDDDRYSQYNELIPIYPDFIKKPEYTQEGFSIVTQMQDKCKYFKGNLNDECCYKCIHYKEKEDLIGICNHHLKRKKEKAVK